MNKLRKTLVLSLACLLLLTTFAAGALASILSETYDYNGECLRTFITHGSLVVTAQHEWQQFRVFVDSLSYEENNTKPYAYARAVSANGGMDYSAKEKIVQSSSANELSPNNSGKTAIQVSIKLYNAFYEDLGRQDYRLRIDGSVNGIYRTVY